MGAEGISTPEGWQVEIEPGHRALDRSSVDLKTYFAAGPGEEINAALYDWEWQSDRKPALAWVACGDADAGQHFHGDVNKAHSADTTGDNFWGLVPDSLPHMEYAADECWGFGAGGRVNRGAAAPECASSLLAAVTVPAGSHVHILLDRKTLTTAYPILTVSGGKGAQDLADLFRGALRQGDAQGRPR